MATALSPYPVRFGRIRHKLLARLILSFGSQGNTNRGGSRMARGVGRSRNRVVRLAERDRTVGYGSPYSPHGQIVPAVVWFPAQAQSDGSVRLRGEARLSLPDTSASRVVAAALQGTRCAVDLAANFSSLAWRKLMQNAVAGLMALTHRRSGMFGRADIARLTLAYLQECLAVARAEGAELGDEVPQEILDKFRAAPTDMSTSILTDREAGRPLEWDIRNGVIARRGQAHGIPTPISDILVPLLAAASDGPG